MYNLNIILQKNAKNEANTIIYREKHRVAWVYNFCAQYLEIGLPHSY